MLASGGWFSEWRITISTNILVFLSGDVRLRNLELKKEVYPIETTYEPWDNFLLFLGLGSHEAPPKCHGRTSGATYTTVSPACRSRQLIHG